MKKEYNVSLDKPPFLIGITFVDITRIPSLNTGNRTIKGMVDIQYKKSLTTRLYIFIEDTAAYSGTSNGSYLFNYKYNYSSRYIRLKSNETTGKYTELESLILYNKNDNFSKSIREKIAETINYCLRAEASRLGLTR